MLMNLYQKMDRNQIQFDFIIDCQGNDQLTDLFKSLGCKVFLFPKFNGYNISEIKKVWNAFLCEHSEYKILHSHVRSYAALYLPIAHKHGVKTIIHSHNTSNGHGLVAFAKDILQLPLRYQADYYLACSNKAGRWLFGKRVLKSRNYRMLHNAIEATRFEYNLLVRKRMRSELNLQDAYVIGHVGRLAVQKNHAFLLDVFYEVYKKRPLARLLLVGDGDARGQIEEKARSLGISDKVIMLGNRTNIQDYYQAMDVFVFPSLWEGLGMAVIEAQASGLNCFVSNEIPQEADIHAGLFHKISLSAGSSSWAENIMLTENDERHSQIEAIKRSGYDALENAECIKKLYLDLSSQA